MKSKAILRCWAEIDHSALRHNLRKIQKRIPASTEVMGMIKANGYGHNAFSIGQTLFREGVRWFGVASVAEALAVREKGLRGSFLILGAALKEEYEAIVENSLVATISSFEEAKELNRVAKKLDRKTKAKVKTEIHFKIDTGMGRLGVWWEEAERDLVRILKLDALKVGGIYTHFASADSDDEMTGEQIRRFLHFLPWFKNRMIHASNSAGFLGKNRIALDCVRPGISLYGYAPRAKEQKNFRPVMSWKTRITAIRSVAKGRALSYGSTYFVKRDARIGVLAVGYADGYPRLLSNQGEVLVRGKRLPIRGRVTMDQILVDLSAVPNARVGDEVVLIGESGREQILATELAEKTGTIAYEILCGVSERVERMHVNQSSSLSRKRGLTAKALRR